MLGSPMPTKQTAPSARHRAAAMVIASSGVKSVDSLTLLTEFITLASSHSTNRSRSAEIASHAR